MRLPSAFSIFASPTRWARFAAIGTVTIAVTPGEGAVAGAYPLLAVDGTAAGLDSLSLALASTNFPAGSLSKHSEAREGIWQNWPDFTAKADAWANVAGKLAAIAPDNVAALRQQMKAVANTCGACHEDYRVKKN